MRRTTLLIILLSLLISPVMLTADDEAVNLVRNPSFEEFDANGQAVGWSGKAPYYTVATDNAKSGGASLHFSHQEETPYVLCSQRLDLDIKKSYVFGAWVKSSNLKGDGPTVCVQWHKDGKFLGGVYPSGVKDTKGEWKKVEGHIYQIPAEATGFDITSYCRKGSTGEAWFDDVYIKEFIPPFLGVMTTDAYRRHTTGAPINVYAAVRPKGGLQPEQLANITLRLLTADGRSLRTNPPTVNDDRSLRFTVQTADLTPGDYLLRLEAINPASNKLETKELTIHRVNALPEWKSRIDEHHRLILDGKPFFPLGMYFGGIPANELAVYRDSAFNCLMPYAQLKRETLDMAEASGIKVIYSVKDFYSGRSGLKTPEEASAKTEEVVNRLKDHPAIIAWYVNDEMSVQRIAELGGRRDQMEQLDPGRPTWSVLCRMDEVRDSLPGFDIIGTDPYPIPRTPPSLALKWARHTTSETFQAHANWMVPQVFNWASYWKGYGRTDEEVLACRAPTKAEMKAMTWMCIAGGANGLIYYSWFDLHRMNKMIADGGRALRIDPFEERWPEVKEVAAEVKEMFDVLLAVDKPMNITLASDNEDEVGYRLYGKDGKTWLLVVNSNHENPTTVTFATPRRVVCQQQRLGGKAPKINPLSIELELAPLEATFLELQ